ncbi:MAG TPA: DUF885 domain-containing protein [Rhodothermales bacterium]
MSNSLVSRAAVYVAGALLLVIGAGCARSQAPLADASGEAWDAFVETFITDYFKHNPLAGVNAGRHEFDGLLPSYHPDSIAAEAVWLQGVRAQAEAFAEESLDEKRRFERDYLIAVVDGMLFWIEEAEWHRRSPAAYSFDPSVYVTRNYAPLPERMRAYTRHVSGIPEAAGFVKQNLRTPLPRTYVALGRILFGGLARFLENDVPPVFASVTDAGLRAEFDSANAAAVAALDELDAWFAGLEASATDDYAIGPELFARMLWTNERVDTPLDELRRIAEGDLDRNLLEIERACAQYAPGKSIPACVQQAEANKPPEGSLAAAERQMKELRAFLIDHNIVSIPSEEVAVAKESPPHMRWNSAFADLPGPYERDLESIYYISPPDPNWPPQDQQDYIPGEVNLLFITVHEVWPGHFLQYLHSNRSESRFGQVFGTYSFVEGWGHYTEEMMWEAGLSENDPEMHIGQLRNALLRNVRFVTALGLHTGTMTVDEAETLFREKGFQDPANARQQAARGTFDPGFLNYTLGKLMIMKLRDDWTATRGGRAAWREFHDTFLSYGGPPIPLVRRAMLGSTEGSLFR